MGGAVHALDQDRPAAVVDDGNDSSQMIARGLRFCGRDNFRAISRVNIFFPENCAVAACGSNTIAPNRNPHAMAVRMMISPLAVYLLGA